METRLTQQTNKERAEKVLLKAKAQEKRIKRVPFRLNSRTTIMINESRARDRKYLKMLVEKLSNSSTIITDVESLIDSFINSLK
mgnify:CR=1 FL=1